ncbi:tripartite tricarboxylate transporter substrate binding protein [Pigmentiphaga sp. GD03639]|uniref:Tripartite tricarboxylate transporter substrate binding protein n=1 Tax=Pigmentiphaga daeguensis TaxID=414049 RepID=A0ABN1CR59_9BURK|nr:tripartite tricarboxylate transporter substrate binding protein [Pigmentiphaga sp. GD03639]MDH2236604.1 tripartite tricarboxylate transporter substrate binding protein [Pigmentiphaga sp. GD03639]
MLNLKACAFALSLALPWAPAGAWAQAAYPAKPVKVVVGFTAGGPTDVVARVIAQHLGERMGQPFIVENRAGAAGSIGAAAVARAAPDGYTLYLAVQTTHAVAPALYPDVGYDPIKDFRGVVRIVHNPLMMVVDPALPVRTVADLVDYAKARPGKLNYATGGLGSSPHMSVELFKKVSGVELTPVHYKGDSAAIVDLLGGQVQMMMSSISGLLPNVQNGKLRPIAVTGRTRSPTMPDLPTIAESGYPDFEVITWFGLVAPARTPDAVVARLNREVLQVLKQPEVREKLTGMGFEVVPNSAEAFSRFMAEENVKWGSLVRELGLKGQ